jgi:hypothetical protein
MNLIGQVLQLASKLPPEGLAALSKLISVLLTSEDPLRATKRAAAVIASEKAGDLAVRAVMKRRPR